jgi:hypothetical protein
MFTATTSAPEGVRAQLRSVRFSLNSPVVAVPDLPTGPAAAGIAVHADRSGGEDVVSLAIRSVRTGQLVFYGPDEDWSDLHGPDLAVDAALSFAESLGFLFDDDAVRGDGGPSEAARRWSEFLADPDDGLAEADQQWLEEIVAPPGLSKFRFVREVAVQARLASAPVSEPTRGPDLWIRLLSRF